MITPDEKLTIELFTKLCTDHGLEKALKICEVAQTMADAVSDKYGKCEEIEPAIEMLSDLLRNSRNQVTGEVHE